MNFYRPILALAAILVLLAPAARADAPEKVLLRFDTPADAKKIIPEDADVQVQLADKPGGHALQLRAAAGKEYAALSLDPSLLKGWETFDYLAMEFHSEDDAVIPLTVELWDRATKNYQSRATLEKGVGRLHSGRTLVLVDLRRAVRNAKADLDSSDWRPGDVIDPAALTRVKVWLNTTGRATPYVCTLDSVRLLREEALDTHMTVKLPPGAKGFTFGKDLPRVEGFTEVRPTEVYAKGAGFGFVDPKGLRVEGRDWPDALTGHYVGGGHSSEGGAWSPARFDFRVDLPDGKYLVWVAAGYFPTPNLHQDLRVNGKAVYDVTMTWENFYSSRGLLRCFDKDYSERPGQLWENYVSELYPAHVVEAEVADGHLMVSGDNSFISSMFVAPAADREAFDATVKQIADERARVFYSRVYLQRPKNEPCAAKDSRLLLFVPRVAGGIMPWSGMAQGDAREASVVATPGESVSFCVGMRPFIGGRPAEVKLRDLAAAGGATLRASAATIYLKNYLSDGNTINPWCLTRKTTFVMEPGLTRAAWVRLAVPADAAPGTYRGKFTVSLADGDERTLPVTVNVYPFHLIDPVPASIGIYYEPPDGGQSASYNQFPDDGARRDELLAGQMQLMHDYGLTAAQLPSPGVSDVRNGAPKLNFAADDKVAAAARAAGLGVDPRQAFVLSTLGPARAIGRKLGGNAKAGAELQLPAFGSAFESAVSQIVNWGGRAKVPLLLWVVDEPREFPNPWNRNLADTIAYCDLAHHVAGAKIFVTPMGDSQGGKDYMPLLDHLDVMATHPTVHSAKMIARAMKATADGTTPALHIYNGGKDRLSNGFYLWRVGAVGKWEWHFMQWIDEPTPGGYPGRDIHNPFLNYQFNAATAPAPAGYPGGVAPMEDLLTMSQGINDYRYVLTLEAQVAKAKSAGKGGTAIAAAEELLQEMRKAIPLTPDVEGYEREDRLADVGKGIRGSVVLRLDEFRQHCAAAIVALRN